MDEFIYGSVASLALAIRQRKISSVEAVAAFQARIGEVNDRLNAVVQHTGERAKVEAQQADAALARGEIRGPSTACQSRSRTR